MAIEINGDTGISGVNGSATTPAIQGTDTNTGLTFGTDTVGVVTGGTTRATVDSSGRLLVGTSSAVNGASSTVSAFQLHGNTGSASSPMFTRWQDVSNGTPVVIQKSRGGSVGTNVVVQNNDEIGRVDFAGDDGNGFFTAARITAFIDGTPGANDMPGRLVFSTTADGASSPTERMRITSDGGILIGKTDTNESVSGSFIYGSSAVGAVDFTRASGRILRINRQSDDGSLIEFCQANNAEGTITVSGSTVSYNGAHLSRWSQLPGGEERTEILRGSVLSNIDEMCDWGEEDNEQLNRMKVSDVEGDKNVSGVFQAWDDDDDTYTNDFYCAMTGDFVIRIAQGVTVERGDLLMSAGDGTAKPQDDDIIRSKTIAKVTSTNVSCTYDDGSYCVPCVLMAC